MIFAPKYVASRYSFEHRLTIQIQPLKRKPKKGILAAEAIIEALLIFVKSFA